MSTSISSIPDKASVQELRRGTIHAPGEPNHGKGAILEVRVAYVGDTLTKWLILRVEGEKLDPGWAQRSYYCKRASGRNIAKLEAELPELREMIRVDAAPAA